MKKFVVMKQDLVSGFKYYEKSDGHFSRNILEAAGFSKKTAEKHVELTLKYMNRFMSERVTVSVEEIENAENEVLANEVTK